MELIPTLMESSNKAGHTPTAINIEAKATETIFSYLLASGRFSNFGSTGPTIVLAINPTFKLGSKADAGRYIK